MKFINYLKLLSDANVLECARYCSGLMGDLKTVAMQLFMHRFYKFDSEHLLNDDTPDMITTMCYIRDNYSKLTSMYDMATINKEINIELGMKHTTGIVKEMIRLQSTAYDCDATTLPSAIRLVKLSLHKYFTPEMVSVFVFTPEDIELLCDKQYGYVMIDNLVTSVNVWNFYYIVFNRLEIPEDIAVEYLLRVGCRSDYSVISTLRSYVAFGDVRSTSITAAYKKAGGDVFIVQYDPYDIDDSPLLVRNNPTHMDNLIYLLADCHDRDKSRWVSCAVAKYICENNKMSECINMFNVDYTACSYLPVDFIVNNFDSDWGAIASAGRYYYDLEIESYDKHVRESVVFYRKVLLAGVITPTTIPKCILPYVMTTTFKKELKKTRPEYLVMLV